MKPRIIPAANISRQSDEWQACLRDAIRDPATLLARLGLEAHALGAESDDASEFRLLVPEPFVRRMQPQDPNDPLLLQVLATHAERIAVPGFGHDPIAESQYERAPGLLQKYRGRALLLAATACAVNCRYCFRRSFPYSEHQGASALPEPVYEALARDPELHEIILSGGDPLLLRDEPLSLLIARLEAIPHLQTLRIHTRLPVVIPSRVTNALEDVLRTTRLRTVVVLHINHGNELDSELVDAIARLRATDTLMLNQSVLLRRVNDDVDVLVALSTQLFQAGVLPYYIHLLDPVAGAAHFQVGEPVAKRLHERMRARLPGYLVPRLVREVPGQNAKTLVA